MSNQPTSVVVTGASNQIGRKLLPLLEASQIQVIAISRKPYTSYTPGIHWLQQDLQSPELPFMESEVLIHLAHISLLPQLLSSSVKSIPSLNRVIAFSSTSSISKRNSLNFKEREMAMNLANAEAQVISWCDAEGIKWTIFRPTLVYGCELDQNVYAIERFIRKFHFFPTIGEAKGLRQPVHARDLAIACQQVIENPNTYYKAYNLSGGETLSYREMVIRIFQKLDKPPIFIKIPLPLLQALLKSASLLPKFRHLTTEMATRMNNDLCYDHSEATNDFSYNPNIFIP